jgi:predicted O-methyltransferase YrrM
VPTGAVTRRFTAEASHSCDMPAAAQCERPSRPPGIAQGFLKSAYAAGEGTIGRSYHQAVLDTTTRPPALPVGPSRTPARHAATPAVGDADRPQPARLRPERAGLLGLLAAGAGSGRIGIRGTGAGTRLGWLAAAAAADARLAGADDDPRTTRDVASMFADDARVTAVCGDLPALLPHGPFDLLVLDGPSVGHGRPPADPGLWLRPGGILVIDAVPPSPHWPPPFDDGAGTARLHWLRHPHLCTAELRLAPDLAVLVATYAGPGLVR